MSEPEVNPDGPDVEDFDLVEALLVHPTTEQMVRAVSAISAQVELNTLRIRANNQALLRASTVSFLRAKRGYNRTRIVACFMILGYLVAGTLTLLLFRAQDRLNDLTQAQHADLQAQCVSRKANAERSASAWGALAQRELAKPGDADSQALLRIYQDAIPKIPSC